MTKYIGPKTDGANVATQSDVGGSSLSDATPDGLTPDQAGAAGTVNSAARADHAHEIICAAAGAILPDDVAAEGTASTFARSDHTHAISAAAPGTITPDAAAAEGSSTSFARADHTHAIVAAAAGTITGTNAEGTSTSFARADHNHALGTLATEIKTSNHVVAESGFSSKSTSSSFNDDSASFIAFDSAVTVGLLIITGNIAAAGSAIIHFRCGDANAHCTAVASAGVTVGTDTGSTALTGTTGTDGRLNFRARTDTPQIEIENRTGGTRAYTHTLLNIVSARTVTTQL